MNDRIIEMYVLYWQDKNNPEICGHITKAVVLETAETWAATMNDRHPERRYWYEPVEN